MFISNIDDINALTKSKTCDEIKKMILNDLEWEDVKLKLIQKQSGVSFNLYNRQSNDLQAKWRNNYEILHREKEQKLNKEQLKFIKNEINTLGLSTAELSRKYFISSSTLSKIKIYQIQTLLLFL